MCTSGALTNVFVQPRFTTFFQTGSHIGLVEGLELVGLHWRLILVEVRQWVLCAVVMRIIVRVDRLCLEARDRVELLDSRRAKARQGAENRTLDLRHLSVLHSINQRVLRLCSVVLQLLRSVLLTERRNLVEVHLQIMGHLLGEVVLRRPRARGREAEGHGKHERSKSERHRSLKKKRSGWNERGGLRSRGSGI